MPPFLDDDEEEFAFPNIQGKPGDPGFGTPMTDWGNFTPPPPPPPIDDSFGFGPPLTGYGQGGIPEEKPTGPSPEEIRKALRDAALERARGGTREAFSARGLNPDKYSSDIENKLAMILAGIPSTSDNPDAYFGDAGIAEGLFRDLTQRNRSKARDLFERNVPTSFFTSETDDPFIEEILAEQRLEPEGYVKNLQSRGLINQRGADAAYADIEKQVGPARARLNEFGAGVLNRGSGELSAARGQKSQAVENLGIEDAFDPTAAVSELNKLASDFVTTIGPSIRAGLGAIGNLFSTEGLAGIGGAASGSMSSPFDPFVISGSSGPSASIDEEDDLVQNSLF